MPVSNKRHASEDYAYSKSEHDRPVTKLKWTWNKYMTYEKLKITSISGIYKTIYHSGSHLLLFGKKKY